MKGLIIPFTGWYDQHAKFNVTFYRGVTTIVGKNGSGKTSMINEINAFLKKLGVPVYHYNQLIEGINIASKGIAYGDITTAATYMQSSEGEKVIVSYGNTLRDIKKFLNANHDSEYAVLLCDGLDSGLSINLVKELNDIFDLLISDYPNIVIVNTTNNYEFTKERRCIVASTGEEIYFDTYDEYVRFICSEED